VDFKNTLIILTSNLGSQSLSQLPEGGDVDVAKDEVMEAVKLHFRPEFINRLDEIVIFDRLSRENMDGIVTIQMARLEKRLASRNIHLELDDDARTWLADEGYDPVFGARPLKRAIQKALQDQLAEMILAGEVLDGTTVPVTVGKDGLLVGTELASQGRSNDTALRHKLGRFHHRAKPFITGVCDLDPTTQICDGFTDFKIHSTDIP